MREHADSELVVSDSFLAAFASFARNKSPTNRLVGPALWGCRRALARRSCLPLEFDEATRIV
jgi:hypothetical protein